MGLLLPDSLILETSSDPSNNWTRDLAREASIRISKIAHGAIVRWLNQGGGSPITLQFDGHGLIFGQEYLVVNVAHNTASVCDMIDTGDGWMYNLTNSDDITFYLNEKAWDDYIRGMLRLDRGWDGVTINETFGFKEIEFFGYHIVLIPELLYPVTVVARQTNAAVEKLIEKQDFPFYDEPGVKYIYNSFEDTSKEDLALATQRRKAARMTMSPSEFERQLGELADEIQDLGGFDDKDQFQDRLQEEYRDLTEKQQTNVALEKFTTPELARRMNPYTKNVSDDDEYRRSTTRLGPGARIIHQALTGDTPKSDWEEALAKSIVDKQQRFVEEVLERADRAVTESNKAVNQAIEHVADMKNLLSVTLRSIVLNRHRVLTDLSEWEWYDVGMRIAFAIPDDFWAGQFHVVVRDTRRRVIDDVEDETFTEEPHLTGHNSRTLLEKLGPVVVGNRLRRIRMR